MLNARLAQARNATMASTHKYDNAIKRVRVATNAKSGTWRGDCPGRKREG